MSFGFSISDIFALGQVAYKVVQSSRKACGEYDELTREVTALHAVLQRLELEISKSDSPINRESDSNRKELLEISKDCRKVLRVLDLILDKYNALDEDDRRRRKLWQKIKFGNGEMNDLADIRSKVITYTTAMTFYLNLVNVGTLGRMEEQMNVTGGVVKEIQVAVNQITIQSIAKNSREGSILTTYSSDDKAVWKEFRRELIESGFSSSDLQKHKNLIQSYVKELGSRGILDEQIAEIPGNTNSPLNAEAAPEPTLNAPRREDSNMAPQDGLEDQKEISNASSNSSDSTVFPPASVSNSKGLKGEPPGLTSVTENSPPPLIDDQTTPKPTIMHSNMRRAQTFPANKMPVELQSSHRKNANNSHSYDHTRSDDPQSPEHTEQSPESKQRNGFQHFTISPNTSCTTSGIESDSTDKFGKIRGSEFVLAGLPSYMKVDKKHISPETLNKHDLPWRWDESTPNFIIIERWLTQNDQDALFEHTRKLQEQMLPTDKTKPGRPTYITADKKHLSPDTLNAYNLPWKWDKRNPDFVIVKMWISEPDQDILFEHTRQLREEALQTDTKPSRPTYIRVDKKHISPETLSQFSDLPWEWDASNPNFIIIKQWLTEDEQNVLFEHTRVLRENEKALQPESHKSQKPKASKPISKGPKIPFL